jgi:hypothetical protein
MKFHKNCARLVSYGPCAALIGSLLTAPLPIFAQDADSIPTAPLRFTVAPHISSQIAMQTLPKAVCMLHADGDSDSSRTLKLFSDDQGMIRFSVTPSDESDKAAIFAVDCTADGQTRTFALHLRPNHFPSFDMPAPTPETRTPQPSDVIRPALTKDEALQLSNEELLKREYPVRPDPNQAPEAFSHWLDVVSRPARRVDSRQVARAELRASTYSNNWSGYDLKNAPGEVPVATYDYIQGEWNVPTVVNPFGGEVAYSVFWVGLDGDDGICPNYCPSVGSHKTSDLWQAGTAQQVLQATFREGSTALVSIAKPAISIAPIAPIVFDFTQYFAWTELVPAQGIEQLANFNVSPGDLIEVSVWVGNPGMSPSLSGAYDFATIENLTQNEYAGVEVYNAQVKVLGYQAEWIMERPYENNALPDLADYNYAYMNFPYVIRTDDYFLSYDSGLQIFMNNPDTGDLLSGAYAQGPGTIYFQWYNYH